MDREKFLAMMPFITSDLAGEIAKKENIDERDAILKLYNSRLYELLSEEETKIWQYSTTMLYNLYKQEENNGKIEFPVT